LTERDLFFERAKTKVLAQTGNLFWLWWYYSYMMITRVFCVL
jgi:hypothetical protein